MNKQAIIERTIRAINQLPEDKAEEISDFADFVSKKFEDRRITQSIQQHASKSQIFDFLNNEEELYSSSDLKIRYND